MSAAVMISLRKFIKNASKPENHDEEAEYAPKIPPEECRILDLNLGLFVRGCGFILFKCSFRFFLVIAWIFLNISSITRLQ